MSDYQAKLERQVTGEAQACIGCNDCILACPLGEARNVTIGELNAAIYQARIHQQNVVDFVTACTPASTSGRIRDQEKL